MNSASFYSLPGIVLAIGLVTVAAARDESKQDEPRRFPDRFPKQTTECMVFRTIYDWRALDRYNLIVWFDDRNTPRHIELETACYSARFVDTIAFTSGPDERLCAYGGDAVIMGDQSCTIGAMRKITKDEAKELISKYKNRHGKKSRKKEESGDD